MNIKEELNKFSKSIVDSSLILVNIVDFDKVNENIKGVQSSLTSKLKNVSASLEENISKAAKEKEEHSEQSNQVIIETKDLDLSATVKSVLIENGYTDVNKIKVATDEELIALKGIGLKALLSIRNTIDK